jgi:hypothetical protein
MDYDSLVVVLASLVSVASAIISVVAGTRTAQLEHRLTMERDELLRRRYLDDVVSRYREPMLRAAIDLQSRFYNIVQKRFLQRYWTRSEAERAYAVTNTLYVVAEYLGWVEILRREVQYLDLGDIAENRTLATLLERITTLFLTDEMDDGFRLFRGEQRAIGELMLVSRVADGKVRYDCLGYATFTAKLDDPQFASWFNRLTDDIAQLAQGGDVRERRLRELQHALVDLIDFFDRARTRVPETRRQKLPCLPGNGPPT